MKNYVMIIIAVLLFGNTAMAQYGQLYEAQYFVKGLDSLPYRIMYPLNYNSSKKYPLVLFLHGAGERGNDNEKQLVHGASLFTAAVNREKFPAIVIFPQCPTDDYWSNVTISKDEYKKRKFDFSKEGPPTKALSLVIDLMDSLSDVQSVNSKRIYVAGLSMGGMGAFEIVDRRPGVFAVAMPICGGGNPENVTKYAQKVSFWIFHGTRDNVVSPHYSIAMVSALQKQGADVGFNLYPNANHNSWDRAFKEPDFLAWMFSKKR